MTRNTLFVASLVALAAFPVCGECAAQPAAATHTAHVSARAHAALSPSSGSEVSGSLGFVDTGHGVRITGRISGLAPDSEHGFHIHQNGDCSAADASSAGAHFNPTNQPHGQPSQGAHHSGDLPNLRANAEGVATVDVLAPDVQLAAGASTNILGRAIVVHAQPDDYRSQPAGDSGKRIACGVITN